MRADERAASAGRFTLRGLLAVIAGIALFLALVTQLREMGFVCALVGALVIVMARYAAFASDPALAVRNISSWLTVAAVILSIPLLLSLLVPSVGSREVRWTPCQVNLQQLMRAFELYHQDHGHYPPAVVTDQAGKPMHSWRALILRYIDEELSRAYDMKEPWNGPSNRRLGSRMPEVFRCPSDKRLGPNMTSYFCVVGPGRLRPGKSVLKQSDLDDEPTILLVEANMLEVNWLEPRDLTVDEVIARREQARAAGDPPCHHGHEEDGLWSKEAHFNCGMHAYRALSLRDDLDRSTLRRLLTVGDNELVDLWDIHPKEYVWPGVWVLLGGELVYVTAMVVGPLRIISRRRRTEQA